MPWDDHLAEPPSRAGIGTASSPGAAASRLGQLRPPVLQAYTALAGVLVAALGRQPAAAAGGQMSGRTRGRSSLSVRYFDDRILLTESHAWAYYRLPTHAYEFTTPPEREALAINITVALAAIRLPDAEAHLRIAHRSYPAAEWAARLDATSDGGPGWRDYLDEMYRHVWAKDFWTKEVYLGVRLGQRGMRAQLSGRDVLPVRQRLPERRAGAGPDRRGGQRTASSPRWTEQAERLGRALSASALRARHATSDEIAWLFRHALAGTVGDPPPSAVHRRTVGAGRSRRCWKARWRTGARCCGWSTRPASRSWRSCPSPGSPTSCRSPTGSRGCTSPTRCRSRSRSAPG